MLKHEELSRPRARARTGVEMYRNRGVRAKRVHKRKRTGNRSRSPTALLSGGGSSPLRPRGSHLPPGEGSSLAMSLRSRRKGKGQPHGESMRKQAYGSDSKSTSGLNLNGDGFWIATPRNDVGGNGEGECHRATVRVQQPVWMNGGTTEQRVIGTTIEDRIEEVERRKRPHRSTTMHMDGKQYANVKTGRMDTDRKYGTKLGSDTNWSEPEGQPRGESMRKQVFEGIKYELY
eukprot:Gb_12955 [translate_table: standard]